MSKKVASKPAETLTKKSSQPYLKPTEMTYQTVTQSKPNFATVDRHDEPTQKVSEYKLYMEKQRQMLTKISSNKVIKPVQDVPQVSDRKTDRKGNTDSVTANHCSFGEPVPV